MQKLEWFGYLMVKMSEDMIIRFDRFHARDRRTDGQTLHDGIGRTCIASRDNKTTIIMTMPLTITPILYSAMKP